MKHTIQIITPKTFEDKQTRQQSTQLGYSFIDEYNHCIIVVYGVSNRDRVSKLLKT